MAEEDERHLLPNEPASNKSKSKAYPEQSKISGKAWGRVLFKFIRLPFPVFFIVWNEFCERFSYYGLRAVLTLFLINFLDFRDNTATAIYHAFIVMCYMTPLGGAIISDSCFGKYGTIVSLSVVYAIGNVLMSVSAIPFNSSRDANIGLTALSLLIIAIGTGGIKPCVAAFGGDQFGRDKIDLLPVFFSVFYFSINAGSVLSTILTPILRSYVSCFDMDTCFPLAFGVPAVLMIVSLFIFIVGTRWYLITRPKREAAMLFVQVPASIVYAIYRRISCGKISGIRNFMDYASPKYSERFVFDVYLFLRVLVMLIPLPVFWALFDQQGSRWTLQAVRMDGTLGRFVVEPDQIQVLNPIFIIVLIPVFETIVYPILHRCHLLRKPLQRMVVGMFLAGLAFCMAGLLEVYIVSQSDRLSNGESRVVITNAHPDPVSIQFGDRDLVNLSDARSFRFNVKSSFNNISVSTLDGSNRINRLIQINDSTLNQFFVAGDDNSIINLYTDSQELDYPNGDKAAVNLFVGDLEGLGLPDEFNFSLCEKSCDDISDGAYTEFDLTSSTFRHNFTEINIGKYKVIIEADGIRYLNDLPSIQLKSGGIYTLVLSPNSSRNGLSVELVGANSPNTVSVFLQIPMYITITAGEVLFSITGLEFAYSQAPSTMKSLCQAAWLLTVAFGNLVVVVVAESSAFKDQYLEFFFFAAAIITVSVVFAIMSYFYKYVDPAKLIADQTAEGYDPPSYNDVIKDSENKGLLSDDQDKKSSSVEKHSLSDVESDTGNGQRVTTTNPSDEESEF